MSLKETIVPSSERRFPKPRNPAYLSMQSGQPLGQHDGIAFYTPGQRRGLGIATGQRLYVQQVRPATNTVLLGPEESLRRQECTVSDLNIFASHLLENHAEVHVESPLRDPSDTGHFVTVDNLKHPRSVSDGSTGIKSWTIRRLLRRRPCSWRWNYPTVLTPPGPSLLDLSRDLPIAFTRTEAGECFPFR